MKETESDWKTYMGSSKWLTADIEKIGKEHFKFEIIAEYKNRRSLRYYELYYQMKFNVLSSTFEGTDEPAYYNSRVGGKFYRPVESYQDPEYLKNLSQSMNTPEYKKKISDAKKKNWKDPKFRENKTKHASKQMTEQWKDPEWRKNVSKQMSKHMKERWKDPEWRKKTVISLRKKLKDPITGRFIKQNVQAKEK